MMGHGPHMMGPGPHGMMGNGMQQMQQSKLPGLSIVGENNTMSNKKSINVSIVYGATMHKATAYQPNPVYIKEGQAIIWTNNDNNIHTVTQRDYSNSGSNQENTAPLPFNSGLLNSGQSFAQLFYKGGKYDYYCTIHPWMIGQVIVSTDSNTTVTATDNNNTNNDNNNNKPSTPSSSSMLMSTSMLQRGIIVMGFDQNKTFINDKVLVGPRPINIWQAYRLLAQK